MTPDAGRPPQQQAPPPPPMSPDPEGLADMTFPVRGVDVSHAHSRQPPLTTPLGVNVRAFEPATLRARGGSRPGLSKYIPGRIPNWSQGHPFQHLNYIVDPAGEATLNNLDYQLGDFTTLDEFGFGDGDFFLDPSLADDWRIAHHGGFIRVGGDLRQRTQMKLKSPRILWDDPADMTVGDLLTGVQLCAQAVDPETFNTVSGSYAYAPVAGTLMDVVGTFDLEVVFTPDSVHVYRPATRTVHVNVVALKASVTADDQEKAEGDVFAWDGTEFTAAGFTPPAEVTSCDMTSAGAPADASPGDYPIYPSNARGAGLDDYAITYIPGTLTVIPSGGGGPPPSGCSGGFFIKVFMQGIHTHGALPSVILYSKTYCVPVTNTATGNFDNETTGPTDPTLAAAGIGPATLATHIVGSPGSSAQTGTATMGDGSTGASSNTIPRDGGGCWVLGAIEGTGAGTKIISVTRGVDNYQQWVVWRNTLLCIPS